MGEIGDFIRRIVQKPIQYTPEGRLKGAPGAGQLISSRDEEGVESFLHVPSDLRFVGTKGRYLDKQGSVQQAGFLISSAGERLIKSQPGLLDSIDSGLKTLLGEESPYKESLKDVRLGKRLYMRRLPHARRGKQSELFLLSIRGVKRIIKTRADQPDLPNVGMPNRTQPYIYEMIQIERLRQEMAETLLQYNVVLPQIDFATSQVMCREYVKGRHASLSDVPEKLKDDLNEFLSRMVTEDPKVWANIKIDLHENNLIRRADGKLVWIDQFIAPSPRVITRL